MVKCIQNCLQKYHQNNQKQLLLIYHEGIKVSTKWLQCNVYLNGDSYNTIQHFQKLDEVYHCEIWLKFFWYIGPTLEQKTIVFWLENNQSFCKWSWWSTVIWNDHDHCQFQLSSFVSWRACLQLTYVLFYSSVLSLTHRRKQWLLLWLSMTKSFAMSLGQQRTGASKSKVAFNDYSSTKTPFLETFYTIEIGDKVLIIITDWTIVQFYSSGQETM